MPRLARAGADYPRTAGVNVTLKAASRADVREADERHLFSEQAHQAVPVKAKKKQKKRR
jgi:hypothetical protein